MKRETKRTRIAVVGTGMVGSSFAYAAMIKGLAAELIMIDASEEREEGEVMDLTDALIGTETGHVSQGTLKDCGDVDIIVITAGAAQKPGQTRLDLVNTNVGILRSLIKGMGKLRQDTVVLIISNPVDILTYIGSKEIDLPSGQVLGSGTSLDTSRLRHSISEELDVNLHNVHGYVLGEHGDTEFTAWSTVNVSTVPASELLSKKQMDAIEKSTREKAYEIIKRKKATYYGIGVVATEIVEAIMQDEQRILPISTEPGKDYGITGISLGVPAVIGRSGVEKVWKVDLTAEEEKKLQASADKLKDILDKVL